MLGLRSGLGLGLGFDETLQPDLEGVADDDAGLKYCMCVYT